MNSDVHYGRDIGGCDNKYDHDPANCSGNWISPLSSDSFERGGLIADSGHGSHFDVGVFHDTVSFFSSFFGARRAGRNRVNPDPHLLT
jgi:hypothetical protein